MSGSMSGRRTKVRDTLHNKAVVSRGWVSQCRRTLAIRQRHAKERENGGDAA